jgi:hypothetical protein
MAESISYEWLALQSSLLFAVHTLVSNLTSIPELPKSLRTRIRLRYLELDLVKFSTHGNLVILKSVVILLSHILPYFSSVFLKLLLLDYFVTGVSSISKVCSIGRNVPT